MSGSGEIFRSRLAFRPFVPAVGGVALLLIAFVVQAHVSYIREREFGRRNWRAELRLDFSGPEAQQTNFLPIVPRTHALQLTLRAPLQGDLADYRGRDHALPAAVTQRALAGNEFAFAWRVLRQAQVVAEGRVCSAALNAWAMRDHACYQYAHNLPPLEVAQGYTLAVQVEQANPAVNQLQPVLAVYTGGSLMGHPLCSNWKLWHTLLFSGVGFSLLLVAYRRWRHDRRPAGRS